MMKLYAEDERMYTVEEIAKITHTSTQTVRAEIRSGRLYATRFGRQWLIPHSDFCEYLNKERLEKHDG